MKLLGKDGRETGQKPPADCGEGAAHLGRLVAVHKETLDIQYSDS